MSDIKVLKVGSASGRKEELNLQPVLDGKRDMTGFPVDDAGNYLCTLTYNESTRTVTITPTGSTFDIFVSGTKYTFTGAQSIQHGLQQSGHFVYFDENGTLVTSQVPWDILLHVPVSYVFRDAIDNLNIAWDERHYAGRDLFWHRNQHFNEGSKIRSGFAASGYTLNSSTSDASITFRIDSGIVEDEDIAIVTEVLPDGGPYTLLRRTGATGDWVINRSPVVPLLLAGSDVAYNNFTGGVWTLTAAGQNRYVNYYVFAATALPSTSVTPSTNNQILLVPGQAEHSSLANANAEVVSSIAWGSIPFQEVAPLYKVTFVRNTGYGTTGRCRIAGFSRIVGTYAQVTSTAQSNHSSLSGLTNDDHPQYPNITSGAVPPAATPLRVGSVYVDTAEPALFVSKGITDVNDWFRVNPLTYYDFTSSGTYTLSPTAKYVRVIGIGPGGGGGSGATDDAGIACSGGGGGGGGVRSEAFYTRAEVLAAYPTGEVPCTVGAGGAGGASITSAVAANGNNGAVGGTTSFGTLLIAYGGGGGGRGNSGNASSTGGSGSSLRYAGLVGSTSTAQGVGAGGNGAQSPAQNVYAGVGGGGTTTAGVANTSGYSSGGGPGGGSGGGISAANAANDGANGGSQPYYIPNSGTSADGGTSGVSGGAGASGDAPFQGSLVGGGGAGGGGGSAGAGGAGGNGNIGAGGGGGGGCRLNYATGKGGDGGSGRIIVMEF